MPLYDSVLVLLYIVQWEGLIHPFINLLIHAFIPQNLIRSLCFMVLKLQVVLLM